VHKLVLLDECDFLPKFQQDDARHIAERYIAKSDPWTVMISTPNAPGGLFDNIEKESFDTCLYKKVFLDYTYGLDKIYTKQEIEKDKASPSFERAYCLKYLGLIGNIFSPQNIELCQKHEYNPNVWRQKVKSTIGLDPVFGSSSFGIVVTQLYNQKIDVMFAEKYERPSFQDMISKVWELKNKLGYVSNIYVETLNQVQAVLWLICHFHLLSSQPFPNAYLSFIY